ncbi:MAG TPA: Flp family type IVb pilin [Acidimicrobiia bacterium]|nr:Flp family type IVb pilin [Acidimicrobiia bacterium]
MLALWTKAADYLRFKGNERGASMVEYALLVVLIAIIAIAAISIVGDEVSGAFSEVGDSLKTRPEGTGG